MKQEYIKNTSIIEEKAWGARFTKIMAQSAPRFFLNYTSIFYKLLFHIYFGNYF